MNDQAMDYEYLVRRAFQCGRLGVTGANADNYRGLEMAEARYSTEMKKGQTKNEERAKELLFKYGQKIGEVSSYVESAINHVQKNYNSELTDEQKKILSECTIKLPTNSTDELFKVVKSAEAVMIELGLYPQ